MADARPARLAALGSPIAHSLSPALQSAAYRVLGLDWQYDAIEVTSAGLDGFLRGLDDDWRGLSLTMPLKRTVMPMLARIDPVAELTGVANTVLLHGVDGAFAGTDEVDGNVGAGRPGMSGFNTDVYGIEQSLRSAGVVTAASARVLGGGATTASLLVALQRLGVHRVLVSVRNPSRAAELPGLGSRLGLDVTVRALDDTVKDPAFADPDVVASTMPGDAEVALDFPPHVRERAVLFDVAYSPWPTRVAAHWYEAGGRVVPGIDMLIHQALLQVRIFVSGNPERVLPDEPRVLAAMSASVNRDLGSDWHGPDAA
ncbi:shikimate dehydrogenase [Planctomonas psychrotolerans]|uniref:shikimate dehydrogenase n=1 Tax=Planctomonas psychrotolerans TaxID=2528712 RepID=UPI00123B1B09|nr:shikimate dehydrogenase [Planctomonas psychrotolerans]